MMPLAGHSDITVCVPVYEGEAVVAQTLASLRTQVYENFRCLISVDLSSDSSAEICRPFATDPRFELFVQDHRLGWTGNCNWLLDRATTPFVCLLPHDDLMAPDYLETLCEAAAAQRDAAVVYSDIQPFGDHDNLTVQPAIAGSVHERNIEFLKRHYNAVAFRGVIPLTVLRQAGPIPGNAHDDFAADTVWLFALLQHGTFVRIDRPLYLKRYIKDRGTHIQWSKWSKKRKRAAWLDHCAGLAEMALERTAVIHEQCAILDAVLFRLLRRDTTLGPYDEISTMSRTDQAAFAQALAARLAPSLDPALAAAWRNSDQFSQLERD
jgi:glycosyltransferase involved in cell wall biosynthesis